MSFINVKRQVKSYLIISLKKISLGMRAKKLHITYYVIILTFLTFKASHKVRDDCVIAKVVFLHPILKCDSVCRCIPYERPLPRKYISTILFNVSSNYTFILKNQVIFNRILIVIILLIMKKK